jgi:hypothetical protein
MVLFFLFIISSLLTLYVFLKLHTLFSFISLISFFKNDSFDFCRSDGGDSYHQTLSLATSFLFVVKFYGALLDFSEFSTDSPDEKIFDYSSVNHAATRKKAYSCSS